MLKTLAKIIDAGGPMRVKYCANTALWVVLNGRLVVETYNDHDKAEDECVRMNNEIVARNVVEGMRECKAVINHNAWKDTIDKILAEFVNV